MSTPHAVKAFLYIYFVRFSIITTFAVEKYCKCGALVLIYKTNLWTGYCLRQNGKTYMSCWYFSVWRFLLVPKTIHRKSMISFILFILKPIICASKLAFSALRFAHRQIVIVRKSIYYKQFLSYFSKIVNFKSLYIIIIFI